MTEKERLEELQTEIHRLEAILKPLYEERRTLKKKMKEEYEETLPYIYKKGLCFLGRREQLYLYYNSDTRTYYTKPLYRESGSLAGNRVSKTTLLFIKEHLINEGYVLVS